MELNKIKKKRYAQKETYLHRRQMKKSKIEHERNADYLHSLSDERNLSESCGWESLMKNVTLGNVTMSHRTRERPAECLASLSHSTMIGLPRAQH
ncbi:hypothetical protein EVAR_48561_1 [Eumeta japonica]|uniref:Uncharacterized protein n=1 Tax=Eumeta variegata TaxID=151549 RepID=A0A4C1XDK9_EUMVA|nr:hypothetical protein EVAR_48561_1 [Eumeta japonica]